MTQSIATGARMGYTAGTRHVLFRCVTRQAASFAGMRWLLILMNARKQRKSCGEARATWQTRKG
jgi:hypothetical protein